jgi:hypothetical protein
MSGPSELALNSDRRGVDIVGLRTKASRATEGNGWSRVKLFAGLPDSLLSGSGEHDYNSIPFLGSNP